MADLEACRARIEEVAKRLVAKGAKKQTALSVTEQETLLEVASTAFRAVQGAGSKKVSERIISSTHTIYRCALLASHR